MCDHVKLKDLKTIMLDFDNAIKHLTKKNIGKIYCCNKCILSKQIYFCLSNGCNKIYHNCKN